MAVVEMSPIFVNPHIRHAILVEPTRVVSRYLREKTAPEQPIARELGGYAAYFSTDLPFAVDLGVGWVKHQALILVPPYRRHRVQRCHGLRTILIEPESVCPTALTDPCWTPGTAAYARWVARIEAGFGAWERLGMVPNRSVDELVFGRDLPRRRLDQRIAEAVRMLSQQPSEPNSRVPALAAVAGLSPSRLSHLFREEIGTSIRRFRAWKRIRNAMQLAAGEPIL
ncbi:MAG: hypothetical protein EON57_02645, partial [Alphaproteobacteria bacterium]